MISQKNYLISSCTRCIVLRVLKELSPEHTEKTNKVSYEFLPVYTINSVQTISYNITSTLKSILLQYKRTDSTQLHYLLHHNRLHYNMNCDITLNSLQL